MANSDDSRTIPGPSASSPSPRPHPTPVRRPRVQPLVSPSRAPPPRFRSADALGAALIISTGIVHFHSSRSRVVRVRGSSVVRARARRKLEPEHPPHRDVRGAKRRGRLRRNRQREVRPHRPRSVFGRLRPHLREDERLSRRLGRPRLSGPGPRSYPRRALADDHRLSRLQRRVGPHAPRVAGRGGEVENADTVVPGSIRADRGEARGGGACRRRGRC